MERGETLGLGALLAALGAVCGIIGLAGLVLGGGRYVTSALFMLVGLALLVAGASRFRAKR